MRLPDERTTPEQWQVIAWAAIVLLIIMGSVGFYFSFQARPEKAAIAQQVRHYSFAFYGLAAGVYAIKRLVGYVLD